MTVGYAVQNSFDFKHEGVISRIEWFAFWYVKLQILFQRFPSVYENQFYLI